MVFFFFFMFVCFLCQNRGQIDLITHLDDISTFPLPDAPYI